MDNDNNNNNNWRRMSCCSCNGKRALCKGCTCAKGKKGCTDCYPGRKGKCVNASIAAPQTSSQPLPRVLSPSCSSAEHASQPSLPTPPQPLEQDSSAVADPGGGAQRARAPPPPPPPPPPRVPPLRIHVHVRLCVRERMQTQRRDIATAELAYTYAYVHNDTWVRAKYEYDCFYRVTYKHLALQ